MKFVLVTSLLWLLLVTSSHASVPAVNGTGNDVSYTTSSSSSMPAGWEGMCSVMLPTAGSRVIRCHVTKDATWEIGTFRNWSQGLEAGHMIELDVTCSRDGAIALPWPYRAPNLRSLTVRNCTLLGWLDESSRPDFLKSMEDKLEYLHMENNVAQLRLTAMIKVMKNSSEEFDCGPRRLRSYKQTGMKYKFDFDEDLTESQTIMLMTEFLQANTSSRYTCRYDQLETYEDTQRDTSGPYTMYLLTRNAEMPRLRHVSLSHSLVRAVPNLSFVWHREFPQLQSLNLSHNLIQNFTLEVFAFMRDGQVDLTYNNITTLNKEELDSMRQVDKVKVDVRHNPFVCACSTADFSDFLRNHKGPEDAKLDPYYSYLWDLTCASPADSKGRKISEFSKDQLCNVRADTKLFLLFLVLPLVALAVVLYLKFQLEIHVFLYRHLGSLGRCSREGSGQGTMDVHVSYGQHDSDMEFVLKELRPRLEAKDDKGSQKYKLSLECRQSEVGAHSAENILTKMADSRAVVMVLSRDMPVDGWAEFEFQEALFRAVSERRRLLVFLQRGPLDIRRLSSALRRALKLFPLIKVGERQFWDKLDYFLLASSATPRVSGRPCRPCPLSRLDAEEELQEVVRLAQADLDRSRQKASSKPSPALDPAMVV